MRRSQIVLVMSALASGCQEVTTLDSHAQETAVVVIEEVPRAATLTIKATLNHSSGDYCFDTVVNNSVRSHAGGCASHTSHGGQWTMNWRAYCERPQSAACEEAYPLLTGRQRTENATYRGVNEHWAPLHSSWGWASCGR